MRRMLNADRYLRDLNSILFILNMEEDDFFVIDRKALSESNGLQRVTQEALRAFIDELWKYFPFITTRDYRVEEDDSSIRYSITIPPFMDQDSMIQYLEHLGGHIERSEDEILCCIDDFATITLPDCTLLQELTIIATGRRPYILEFQFRSLHSIPSFLRKLREALSIFCELEALQTLPHILSTLREALDNYDDYRG